MKTEGRNAVLELLKTDKTVEKILLEKGAQGTLGKIFAEARKKNIRVQFADARALERESESGRHQGVIAYVSEYAYADLEEIISCGAGRLVVLCDGIDYEGGRFVGRAYWSAPDIDGKVYFRAPFAEQGRTYRVLITEADSYDLFGQTEEQE